ncbi:uncharacterized protein LOC132197758 [Neocloeon triangulifer]|uniref:uncharacterized protein LOC132197758 n=1 Tax=Neocloeon triangulifer TaxID=2078957 RepID=UPI00286F6993|nr:uncharacterized protein LOC132197758 [Neocloeon triangulifer]
MEDGPSTSKDFEELVDENEEDDRFGDLPATPFAKKYKALVHHPGPIEKPFKRPAGKSVNQELRRAILSAHFTLIRQPGENRSYTQLATQTALLLGVSERTVLNVLKTGEKIETPKKGLNRPAPVTGVDSFTLKCIQNLIYEMKRKGEHTTINTVMDRCVARKLFEGSTSSLRRLLKDELSFSYRKTDFREKFKQTPQNIAWRRTFLRRYLKLKKLGYTFIFLDETWIFQNGSNVAFGWFDGSSEAVGRVRASNGKRFIIVHAGSADGFVKGASLIFPSKVAHMDYHGDMSADYFMKWAIDQLIPNLPEKCCIVIDNASYHSTVLEKRPVKSRSKAELKEWLDENKIPFDPKLKKKEMFELCLEHVSDEQSYVFDYLLEKNGHVVLRNAPYNCIYNAIEHIWSTTKGKYNKLILEVNESHSKEVVIATWERALREIPEDAWKNSVAHCEKLIEEHFKQEGLTLESPNKVVVDLGDFDSDEELEPAIQERKKQIAEKAAADTRRKESLLEKRLHELNEQFEAKRPKKKATRRKLLSESAVL